MSTNRLLIVDDEAAIARLIEQAAREIGFEVRAIFDSQDFEKAVQEIDPNVVFLDMNIEDAAKVIISAGMVTPESQAKLRELADQARRKPKITTGPAA